ncbi:MAG: arginine--tRNA ligase [Patescibacteria group bacterium]|nr:arginine--tRNA ligase [Patescibacteria group bacterium]
MKFKLSKKFIKKYPDAIEHIVIARGINNEIPGKWISDQIKKETEKLQNLGAKVLEEPKYSKWVEIYKNLAEMSELKARDFLPSHVALAKRILAGKDVPNINPVVNFYNLYSIRYGIPVGGENRASVYGDVVLDFAQGGEKFLGIGSDEVDTINTNEVIWKDDHSVTCRMWAWRQSDRTKLIKSTKDIYFVFDGIKGLEGVDLESTVKEFSKELTEKFGGTNKVVVLDKNNPEFEVDYESKDISDVDVEKYFAGKVLESAKKKKKPARKNFMKRKSKSMGLVDRELLVNMLGKKIDHVVSKAGYAEEFQLKPSQNPEFGDFSSAIALRLTQKPGKPPQIIAQEIVDHVKSDQSLASDISDISVAPNGFINLRMSESFLTSELSKALRQKEKYGLLEVGKKRTILVESPSINPNAPAHAGHLLNIFIGRALMRLFQRAGFIAKADNAIHNKGVKVCMAMWGVKNLSKHGTPDGEDMKSDQFVGKYYIQAKEKYWQDEEVKAEIDQMLRDWEASVPEVIELWEKVVGWAYEGHEKTFERLNEDMGYLWFESDYYEGGRKVIEEHLGRGVLERLPDGAIVARLEEKYGVSDPILLRSDGTSLYHTQDINLTLLKMKKFDPWKAIWVVGSEQIMHFQGLFAALDAMGILDIDRVYHFPYGLIIDKNGRKLGKESGNATADDLLDQMNEAALQVIDHRKISVELDNKDKVAETVGLGALRFSFLSKDLFKDVIYDPESALSFTGRSGPYVMYAYTRGRSVLRKIFGEDTVLYGIKVNLPAESSSAIVTKIDRELILKLLSYPDVILSAANNYAPNVLAEYLYEVASMFNNFYEHESVSGAKGREKDLRVAITALTTRVLKDGLAILGIDVLERM